MKFLNSRYAKLLTVVLLLEIVGFYGLVRRPEFIPKVSPLSQFPSVIGSWRLSRDLPVEPEVEAVLKADDTLSRTYTNTANEGVFLFVAFFKTQRAGQAPHSPKNCLPGAGWEPLENRIIQVDVPPRQRPIEINKYVVAHGSSKIVTLYWYQSRDRVIASEFAAKFWLVADSIRYDRSDSSLVKVEVAVNENDTDAATRTGVSFLQAAFPVVSHYLPR